MEQNQFCQEPLQKKDEFGNRVICTLPAKWHNPIKNKYFCGRHAKEEDKRPEYAYENKKKGAASSGSKTSTQESKNKSQEEVYYSVAIAAITSKDPGLILDDEEKNLITNLRSQCDDAQFSSIMHSAYSFSGSTSMMINGVGIANYIPRCFSGYRDAKYQKKMDIPRSLVVYPPRNSNVIVKQNEIYYPRENIKIVNCRNANLEEWIKVPNNIYMGPKYDIFLEDSEWFIPLPIGEKLRMVHNTKKVKEIMDDIVAGKEDPKKYLSLKNKVLGCLCIPSACHCEVYVDVVSKLMEK